MSSDGTAGLRLTGSFDCFSASNIVARITFNNVTIELVDGQYTITSGNCSLTSNLYGGSDARTVSGNPAVTTL